jgi:hypothetical protein
MKIGEQFSGVYENEWTDAFLNLNDIKSDDGACINAVNRIPNTPCLIIGSLTIIQMNASMCKYVLTLKILSKITMASSSLIN